MRKFIWSSIATIFMSFHVCAQIVIDSSIWSGYTIPFHDTTLSSISSTASCLSSNFPVDLNGDSSADVEFSVTCSMGGFASSFGIKVKSFGDFKLHSDTNYIEHFQYIAPGGIATDTSRTCSIVRKYILGDVVQGGEATLSTELPIYSYSHGNFPSCTYTNIQPVLSDTFYIAVESATLDVYCFKLANPIPTKLELFSIRSSVSPLKDVLIFPNPSADRLYFNKAYTEVEIYNNFGALVMTQAAVFESMDVSRLSNGTYWVSVNDNGAVMKTKFVKLTP
ncbi:MAG: Secretion system C-terminal sorting domain [Bacteroidota bacterium]